MLDFISMNPVVIIFIFVALITIIGGLIYAVYKLFQKMALIAEQTDVLLSEIDSFADHLNVMNTSDLFFGEPTIVSLVNHSKYLTDVIYTFLDIFSFMKIDKEQNSIEEETEIPETEVVESAE